MPAEGFSSKRDTERVAKTVVGWESQNQTKISELSPKGPKPTAQIVEGIYLDDLFPAENIRSPSSARMRVLSSNLGTINVSTESPITVTNRSRELSILAGTVGIVIQIGDEWRPSINQSSCAKPGWLDSELVAFSEAEMTVATYNADTQAWCETNEVLTVVDFVGLGASNVPINTGIVAQPLCYSPVAVVVTLPCEYLPTRPIVSASGNGCIVMASLASSTNNTITIAGA